ncbi:uncharacterized protein [Macrobrachium rosenbergii]|uniref:uncharacterized protein n=1 Tax=Macrobrachium rosenbergii TaxID=79674 RepID=UPI0034D5A3E6
MAMNTLLLPVVVLLTIFSMGYAIPPSHFMVGLPVDGVELEDAAPVEFGPRDYFPNILAYSSLHQGLRPQYYPPTVFKAKQGKRYLGIELPDYIADKGLSQLKEKMMNSGK